MRRPPPPRSRRIGRGGERLALAWLRLKGYRLRDRNWRGGGAELDLVMEHGDELVFVEVKARSGGGFGGAVGAVRDDKRRAVERAAAAYLTRHGAWDRRARFDVVAIDRTVGPPWWRLRHYRNAFPATGAPVA